jgi:hypothetical protein
MKRVTYLVGAVAMAAMMAWPAAAQQPAQMTAAVGDNMNHVPSFVGVEKGIFLKHGVDVKLKVLATGQQMSQALQAGEVQIIGSAYSNYPLAVERGMAAKGVVGLMGDRSGKYWDQSVTIWTRKGTGITKIEELAGRKLGTPAGGTADEYLGVVLMKKGVPREKVEVLNVPPGNIVSALQGGSIFAIPLRTVFPPAFAPIWSVIENRIASSSVVFSWWTPWPAGSRSPRRSRPRSPTRCSQPGRRVHRLLYQHGGAERHHRETAGADREVRDRYGRGHLADAQKPRRGSRDLDPLDTRAGGGCRQEGAYADGVRRAHHAAHSGCLGRERQDSPRAEKAEVGDPVAARP